VLPHLGDRQAVGGQVDAGSARCQGHVQAVVNQDAGLGPAGAFHRGFCQGEQVPGTEVALAHLNQIDAGSHGALNDRKQVPAVQGLAVGDVIEQRALFRQPSHG
jgi:hypothetical protein